jgi:hypothetical protein
MLKWPTGRRNSDGVWAAHWYQNVIKSSAFQPYQTNDISLTIQQQRIVDECLPYYQSMMSHAIAVE